MNKMSFLGGEQLRWKVVKISAATLASANARIDLYRRIGERIAYTRKARGLSQTELGQLIGCFPDRIKNIETCRFNTRLSVAILHSIAIALSVSIAEFLPTNCLELARVNIDEGTEELAIAGIHQSSYYQQEIGRRIYNQRTARGVEIKELVRRIDCPPAVVIKKGRIVPYHNQGLITKIEVGEIAPDIFLLLAIANALDCAIEDLIPPTQVDTLSGIVDILFRTEKRGAMSPNALLFRDLFRQGYGDKIVQAIEERLESMEGDEAIGVRSNYLVGLLKEGNE